MDEQEELKFTRTNDYDTSIDAAKKVKKKVSKLMRSVYGVLSRYAEGLTDSELRKEMIALGFKDGAESTYRRRRTDLTTLGYVVEMGHRRENERGNSERVWGISTVKPMESDPDEG